jgi:hypothetical protein
MMWHDLAARLRQVWWALAILAAADVAWYPVVMAAPSAKSVDASMWALLVAVPLVHFAVSAVVGFLKGLNWPYVAAAMALYLVAAAVLIRHPFAIGMYGLCYAFMTTVGVAGAAAMKTVRDRAKNPPARRPAPVRRPWA